MSIAPLVIPIEEWEAKSTEERQKFLYDNHMFLNKFVRTNKQVVTHVELMVYAGEVKKAPLSHSFFPKPVKKPMMGATGLI